MMQFRTERIISIPNPCTIDKSQMQTTQCGKYCPQCQKTVFSVTHLEDDELVSLLERMPNACYNLKASQLNRNLNQIGRKVIEETFEINISIHLFEQLLPQSLFNNTKEPNWCIAGYVLDDNNGKGISNIEIIIEDLGIEYTNELGWFYIKIPNSFPQRLMIMKATKIHKDDETIQYNTFISQAMYINNLSLNLINSQNKTISKNGLLTIKTEKLD